MPRAAGRIGARSLVARATEFVERKITRDSDGLDSSNVDPRSQNALAFLTRQDVDDHIGRARRLLERAIRQRWADGQLGRDQDQVADLERMMKPPAQTIDVIDDHAFAPDSPIGDLARTLGLGPTESDLFAVLLACETDPASARLAAYLSNGALTVDTIFEIAYRPRRWKPADAAALLHADLAAEGPARGLKFLIVDGSDSRSFLSQGVRIHPRLVAWLLGRRNLAPELAAKGKLIPPGARDAREPLDDLDHNTRISTLVNAFESQHLLVALHGAAGSGRELLLRSAAQALGRPLLLVLGRDLDPNLIVPAFREAVLHGALLAFMDCEEAFAQPEAIARLRECLGMYAGTVAICGAGTRFASIAALRVTTEIEIPVPPYARRLELWKAYLDDGMTSMIEAEWKSVAGLYNLGIGGIERASRIARDVAVAEGKTIVRSHVTSAVRQMFESDLTTVAKRMEVSQTWEDVVLPEDVMQSIVAVVDRVEYRNAVLGDWGFGRKVGKGLGLTVLFSGQPGTGKSMVAGLIARELGLDLYVIDLSRVVSKWLGETEKNLGRAFDAAEAGHVLLLFDEADSILGKRTMDVRNANDKHANMETNFILARLEQFHGVAVFTTNIASAIDPAIARRMSANITFPFPDVEARAELWKRMIPAEAPVAGNIDFIKLAKQFEISGGFIRNVVLRAAFLAAREGKPISGAHLEKSAKGEYGDRGALTVGGRLT